MQRLVAELRSLPASELNFALTALLAPAADRPSRFFIWDLLQAIAWIPADTHLPAPEFTAPSTLLADPSSESAPEAGFVQLKLAILDLLTHERLHELQLPARAVLICALYCAGRRARLSLPNGHGHNASLHDAAGTGRHHHGHGHGHSHQPTAHGQLLFRRSLSPRFASAIASVLLGTGGVDLSRLKDAVNVCGATDLFELVYSDLQEASPALAVQLLQHFAAEAALLRASRGGPVGRQVISDVDDTLIAGWLESRYARGQAIPGAVELVRALRSQSCSATDGDGNLRIKPLLQPDWWLATQALRPPAPLTQAQGGPRLTPVRVDDVDRADAAFAPPASVVRRLLNRLRSKRSSSAATASPAAVPSTQAAAAEPPPPFSVDARQMDSFEAMARELEGLNLAAVAPAAAAATDATTPSQVQGVRVGVQPAPQQAASRHAAGTGADEAASLDAADVEFAAAPHPRQTRSLFPPEAGDRDSHGVGGEPAALQLLESLPSPTTVAFDVKRKKLRTLTALADASAASTSSNAVDDRESTASDSQWQWRHDGWFPSSMVLVTARPADLRGLLKRRTLQSVGSLPLRCHVLALLGSLRASTSTAAIVGKKLDNAMRAAALVPELDLVLLGDTGQGDAAVYAHVLRRLTQAGLRSTGSGSGDTSVNGAGLRQRAHAFLHHVNPEAASAHAPAVSGDGADIAATYASLQARAAGLHVCATWAEAAAVAAAQGLIAPAAAKDVAAASLEQFEAQLLEEQEQRRRDAAQAHAEASKRSRFRLSRALLRSGSSRQPPVAVPAAAVAIDSLSGKSESGSGVDVDALAAAQRAIVSRLRQLIAKGSV